MAASYPGSIKSFSSKTDNVDDVLASHMNDVQDEVHAIENNLGINPLSDYTETEDTTTSDETTSSTSYVDTTLSITFTPGRQSLVFIETSGLIDATSGAVVTVALVIDGVVKKATAQRNAYGPMDLYFCTVLSAASHTVKIQQKVSTSSGGIVGTQLTGRLKVTYRTN